MFASYIIHQYQFNTEHTVSYQTQNSTKTIYCYDIIEQRRTCLERPKGIHVHYWIHWHIFLKNSEGKWNMKIDLLCWQWVLYLQTKVCLVVYYFFLIFFFVFSTFWHFSPIPSIQKRNRHFWRFWLQNQRLSTDKWKNKGRNNSGAGLLVPSQE